MSSTWKKFPLQELTENNSPITYGVVKPGEVGNVLFIRGGDLANGRILSSQLRTITHEVSKQYERTVLRGGELLISLVGQPGQVAVVPSEFAGSNIARQVGLIRLRRGIDANFICYFLQSPDGRKALGKYTGGSVQQVINLCDLRMLSTPNPSLSEQKRIVAIVDQAFEAIDGAIENTKQNLANARELFESYLNDVFDRKGDRWKTKRLGDLAEVQSGGTPSRAKNEYWGGSIAWYSSGELNDLHTVSPERHITDQGLENSNAKSFPKSSLLIGMYDTAALKMSILDREAAFNQAIAGVKPNKEIDLVFILHAINYVKPEILNLRRGVRQKNLSLQKIKDVILAVPPLTEQKQVVQQLALMTAETQRLEAIYRQKLADLTELKQSILQKAFTGELTADSAKAR